MKLGLAQVNPTVGDLEGNVLRCLEAIRKASKMGADLVLLPEMAIPGYPPRDILFDDSFVEATLEATRDLARRARRLAPALVGSIQRSGQAQTGHPGLYNTACLLQAGIVSPAAHKRLLPGYDVFHEPRWFLPGTGSVPLSLGEHKIGVLVCEDLWDEGYPSHPPLELMEAGADTFLVLAAMPFRSGALSERLHHARDLQAPVALANLVGGNDELIFDGRSFVMDGEGRVIRQLAGFREEVCVMDFPGPGAEIPADEPLQIGEVYSALVLGLGDLARKNNIRRGVLGISGGIDSAVTAVLAAESLGAGNVTGIAIPSRFTDRRSTENARLLAARLGIHFEVVEMEEIHRSTLATLPAMAEGLPAENIQARIRMMILMAFVNLHGGMLVNTSNKTELALGYSTLYGDMAGTISPLGDLTKLQVYDLARFINRIKEVIPSFCLERPPSAELRPGQIDPFDYDILAPQVESLVQGNLSNDALKRSEHKRQQMGIILKVSGKAFGSGRMMPVTRR